MAKRYLLCDIIGNGEFAIDPSDMENTGPFRPRIALDEEDTPNYIAAFPPEDTTQAIPTTPAIRFSGNANCLVLIKATDLRRFVNDPKNDELPDVTMDVQWNAIGSNQRNATSNAAIDRGLTTDWQASDPFRVVVRSIGKQLDANFDEDNFDVSD